MLASRLLCCVLPAAWRRGDHPDPRSRRRHGEVEAGWHRSSERQGPAGGVGRREAVSFGCWSRRAAPAILEIGAALGLQRHLAGPRRTSDRRTGRGDRIRSQRAAEAAANVQASGMSDVVRVIHATHSRRYEADRHVRPGLPRRWKRIDKKFFDVSSPSRRWRVFVAHNGVNKKAEMETFMKTIARIGLSPHVVSPSGGGCRCRTKCDESRACDRRGWIWAAPGAESTWDRRRSAIAGLGDQIMALGRIVVDKGNCRPPFRKTESEADDSQKYIHEIAASADGSMRPAAIAGRRGAAARDRRRPQPGAGSVAASDAADT